MYIGPAGILFDTLDAGRFGDRENPMPPRQKCKRDLSRGRIMRLSNIREQAAVRRVTAWKIAVSEQTIRGDGETMDQISPIVRHG